MRFDVDGLNAIECWSSAFSARYQRLSHEDRGALDVNVEIAENFGRLRSDVEFMLFRVCPGIADERDPAFGKQDSRNPHCATQQMCNWKSAIRAKVSPRTS